MLAAVVVMMICVFMRVNETVEVAVMKAIVRMKPDRQIDSLFYNYTTRSGRTVTTWKRKTYL
jgi:hypothetical protein